MTLEDYYEKMREEYGADVWNDKLTKHAKSVTKHMFDKFDGMYVFECGTPEYINGLTGFAKDISEGRGSDYPNHSYLVMFLEVPGVHHAHEYAQAGGKNSPGLKDGDFYPWQRSIFDEDQDL